MPLNGTCIMRMPVTLLSISPQKCTDDPVPNDPYENLSGAALAYATGSLRVRTGTSLFTSSTSPMSATRPNGVKLLTGS